MRRPSDRRGSHTRPVRRPQPGKAEQLADIGGTVEQRRRGLVGFMIEGVKSIYPSLELITVADTMSGTVTPGGLEMVSSDGQI